MCLMLSASGYAERRQMKILAVGNSFTVDAVQDDLVPMAAADSIDLIIGYPYKGGTSLKQHLQYITADSTIYNYRKATPSGPMPYRPGSTMKQAVEDDDWELVILQTNYSGGSGFREEYYPYIDQVRDSIKAHLAHPDDVRWGLYMTWAYDKDSKHKHFPKYNNDQNLMYSMIAEVAPFVMENTDINIIIPAGTAIQNLRTTKAFGDRMNRDGYHMNLDHGRYTVACVWYEALTGRSPLGNSYRPKELSPYQATLCQIAAHLAVQNPYQVTDMSSFGPDPLIAHFGDSIPQRLELGTTIGPLGGLKKLSYSNLRNLRNSDMRHIEVSLTGLVNGDNPMSEKELQKRFRKLKHDADSAGINIWSIHMPYGIDYDASSTDEKKRRACEAKYRKYIDLVSVLEPEYILFHPSASSITPGCRTEHISQAVKTISNLNKDVKRIGAAIVVENLRGPHLLRPDGTERGLGRTVDEMCTLMDALPGDIYAAVDLNHIANPEKLIRALGGRVKSLHVSDSDQTRDCHFLPGRGTNDWPEIIAALYETGYDGPWLYEIKQKEVEVYGEMTSAYNWAYRSYLEKLYDQSEL